MRIARTLFRAHVLQRADQFAHIRLQRGEGDIGIGGAGDAEVDDFDATTGRGFMCLALRAFHQDVGGFEVAMNDPFLMAVVDCITNVGEQFESPPDGEFVIFSKLNDRTGIGDELHREVRHSP